MEPQSEIKIAQIYTVKLHLAKGFCKCCQPQLHWYDMGNCQIKLQIGDNFVPASYRSNLKHVENDSFS